jgi:hypothetical protein
VPPPSPWMCSCSARYAATTCAMSSAHERLNVVEKGTREMTFGLASLLGGESQ